MTMIDQTRLEKLADTELLSGSHGAQQSLRQACVMEAVAWVAGEPWSDHPACACPALSEFLRSWNDALPDNATRDRLLKPLVPRLIGSRSTPAVELRRSLMALDWLARVHTPAWLDLAGLKNHAQLCRGLDEFCDAASAKAGIRVLNTAWDAAWAAAGDDTGWAAARTVVGVAAGDAAWTTAAPHAAAAHAAWNAACAAAGAAAGAEPAPTVALLQASALELIDRMLAAEP